MMTGALMLASTGEEGTSTLAALRVFLAVAIVVVLSLFATARPFYRIQRTRAVGALISGGWAAIAVGILLGPHALHVIDGNVLLEVRPLLMIGLGWIGVIVGMQGRREIFRRIPSALWRWTLIDAVLSVLLTATIAAIVMSLWLPPGHRTPSWIFAPVVMLASCMIGWAPETRSIRVRLTPPAGRLAVLVQSGAGLSGMLAIGLFGLTFSLTGRDEAGRMGFTMLEAASGVVVALAVATLLGLGGRFMLRRADRSRPETLTVFIGLVALFAGVAADLEVSPLLGSMLAGIVIANLAGPRLRAFERFILGAEHTVALMFSLLAGVLLEPAVGLWGVWLVTALLLIRLAVKPYAMSRGLSAHAHELPPRSVLYAAPIRQSPVAIAIAVGFVISEASMFNRRLLTVIVLVGLAGELIPYGVSLARSRRIDGARVRSVLGGSVGEGA